MGRELGCIGGGYPTGDGKRGCLIGINFGPLSIFSIGRALGDGGHSGRGGNLE